MVKNFYYFHVLSLVSAQLQLEQSLVGDDDLVKHDLLQSVRWSLGVWIKVAQVRSSAHDADRIRADNFTDAEGHHEVTGSYALACHLRPIVGKCISQAGWALLLLGGCVWPVIRRGFRRRRREWHRARIGPNAANRGSHALTTTWFGTCRLIDGLLGHCSVVHDLTPLGLVGFEL